MSAATASRVARFSRTHYPVSSVNLVRNSAFPTARRCRRRLHLAGPAYNLFPQVVHRKEALLCRCGVTMPAERRFAENDPLHPTTRLKHMLTEVSDHAREDIPKISEARAKALFEKTANAERAQKRIRRLRKRW